MTRNGCSQFEETCALVAAGAALPEEERTFFAHLAKGCPACKMAYAELLDVTTHLAKALSPIAPPVDVRARLLGRLACSDRFQPFFSEVARLFDLSVDAVHDLLSRIDDVAAWEPGPLPFVRLIHFQSGPRLAGFDTGLVRIAAGAAFPRHRHLGKEVSFVLEGSVCDNGQWRHAGEIIEWETDSVHEYRAGPHCDLVALVAYQGIEIL